MSLGVGLSAQGLLCAWGELSVIPNLCTLQAGNFSNVIAGNCCL